MKLINNFILEPDEYLLPSYIISPFSSKYFEEYKNTKKTENLKKYLNDRFKKLNTTITLNGRQAINLALNSCKLTKNDCVTIFTTSNNLYISGCVTKEIEKFCSWSRKIEKNTKAIFINHEFGYPYKNIKTLKKYNLPIIEDFAHSFFLEEKKSIESDFAIYSFPKMFPIQIGGLLVSKEKISNQNIKKEEIEYITKIVSHEILNKKNIIKKRLQNYSYLKKKLKKIKIIPFFKLEKNIIPGIFMFKTPKNINLNDFKIYMNNHGVQSSVFYGENAYFIPIHQNLTKYDLDYFFETIKNYLKK